MNESNKPIHGDFPMDEWMNKWMKDESMHAWLTEWIDGPMDG